MFDGRSDQLIPRGCVATFKKQQAGDWLDRSDSVSCGHLEQLVDELNLLPNIRTAHPPQGSDQIGVESTTGAVAVGKGGSCCRRLSPIPVPHSSPWLRFQSPLIEPDMQISRIRLSDEIMPSHVAPSGVAQG